MKADIAWLICATLSILFSIGVAVLMMLLLGLLG